ncbi:reverse transcriptase domain-containing protein [Streptomyces sp. NBC_00846]|uniref:reverse transcriptase domain-containing protein n=1 Tax=Streptomyces sp. NBC_00846 TaxID=2975849 RepID=UPI003867B7E7|nr:reverse transcriptase domain-containing protein [Streptomyces sp. NBC_00846]
MNTDELEHAVYQAERKVLKIQTKLHCWARDDPHRRFDDLFNLVADPAFLLVAWDRVRSNKGARTAGVDGRTARSVEAGQGVEDFLDGLRSQVKDRSFQPLPVRERMIPKTGGKLRRLGIATVTDRVVQASLKLVLEPIFEAEFLPCSYGFRPNRRAHDAVAEVRHMTSRSYEWIVEGDIKACFDREHAASGHQFAQAPPVADLACHQQVLPGRRAASMVASRTRRRERVRKSEETQV